MFHRIWTARESRPVLVGPQLPRRGLPAKVVHSSPENDELEGMIIVLRKFASDRSGNFAIMSAILSVPLIMAAGLAVDYARYSASHRHLQELADITSLNLAASKELNEAKLRKMAEDTIEANRDRNRLRTVSIANLTTTAEFLGTRETALAGAEFNPTTGMAELSVRFVGEMIVATRDAAGNVVEGDAKSARKQRDIWTFGRRMGAADPNWQLVATA